MELKEPNRDNIRLIAVYEKERSISRAEGDQPRSLYPSEDPRPDSFKSAIRQQWRRSKTKPTIKQNPRSQSFFGQPNTSGQTGVAKRAVARLENHEKLIGPVLLQLLQAASRDNADSCPDPNNTETPVAGQTSDIGVRESRINGSSVGEEGSQDPRR
ncbi:MAG: hypothetical protein Q9164_002167 [Protoblastenia rupestris]